MTSSCFYFSSLFGLSRPELQVPGLIIRHPACLRVCTYVHVFSLLRNCFSCWSGRNLYTLGYVYLSERCRGDELNKWKLKKTTKTKSDCAGPSERRAEKTRRAIREKYLIVLLVFLLPSLSLFILYFPVHRTCVEGGDYWAKKKKEKKKSVRLVYGMSWRKRGGWSPLQHCDGRERKIKTKKKGKIYGSSILIKNMGPAAVCALCGGDCVFNGRDAHGDSVCPCVYYHLWVDCSTSTLFLSLQRGGWEGCF